VENDVGNTVNRANIAGNLDKPKGLVLQVVLLRVWHVGLGLQTGLRVGHASRFFVVPHRSSKLPTASLREGNALAQFLP